MCCFSWPDRWISRFRTLASNALSMRTSSPRRSSTWTPRSPTLSYSGPFASTFQNPWSTCSFYSINEPVEFVWKIPNLINDWYEKSIKCTILWLVGKKNLKMQGFFSETSPRVCPGSVRSRSKPFLSTWVSTNPCSMERESQRRKKTCFTMWVIFI